MVVASVRRFVPYVLRNVVVLARHARNDHYRGVAVIFYGLVRNVGYPVPGNFAHLEVAGVIRVAAVVPRSSAVLCGVALFFAQQLKVSGVELAVYRYILVSERVVKAAVHGVERHRARAVAEKDVFVLIDAEHAYARIGRERQRLFAACRFVVPQKYRSLYRRLLRYLLGRFAHGYVVIDLMRVLSALFVDVRLHHGSAVGVVLYVVGLKVLHVLFARRFELYLFIGVYAEYGVYDRGVFRHYARSHRNEYGEQSEKYRQHDPYGSGEYLLRRVHDPPSRPPPFSRGRRIPF